MVHAPGSKKFIVLSIPELEELANAVKSLQEELANGTLSN